MHKILTVLLLCICFITYAGAAETTSKDALADELITAFDIKANTEFDINEVVELIIKSEPQFTVYRDVLKEFYTKHLTWSAIKPEFEKIIISELTEGELTEINTFLKTKAFKDWVTAKGEIDELPEEERANVVSFITSPTGEHFFSVTEELANTSNTFIGKVTLDHKEELDAMINAKTSELVK